MAQASRTFRIFVSSTFSDLKEERNALQKEVFPKLRELCMQHGCRFQAIDLRWGVREEAGLDQQTMKICLDEIARCQRVTPRPNFIVLLGDRYGWRPLPAEIPADEFEEIERRTTDAIKKKLLATWYKHDENAMPPVYCLHPRLKEGGFADFETWDSKVERPLRQILLKAIAGMTLTQEQSLKYVASATEQEIVAGALTVPDAQEHVFCYFREIANLDDFTKDLSHTPVARDFLDTDESENFDNSAHAQLQQLKERLRLLLPLNIQKYDAQWTGGVISYDHIIKLCDDVFAALSRVIETEIARLESIEALDKEIAEHQAFGDNRAKFFIGRADILQTISDYIRGTDRHPLGLVGESGSGKSALMARAVEQARNQSSSDAVLVRFIGATPESSDTRSLLESLCRQISRRYGADEATIPSDYKELVQELPKRLALATPEKPLIVFLDALDQLSDADYARNLTWLPAELPDHARLIVSTLPGQCLTALERKLPPANLVKLEPMPKEEGSKLLQLWLAAARRTLQDLQREEVLGKFAANGLPLYLKLAFEEARRWKSYTKDFKLSDDIPGVIRGLFGRLSSEPNHGPIMVSRSLAYLAAAKTRMD